MKLRFYADLGFYNGGAWGATLEHKEDGVWKQRFFIEKEIPCMFGPICWVLHEYSNYLPMEEGEWRVFFYLRGAGNVNEVNLDGTGVWKDDESENLLQNPSFEEDTLDPWQIVGLDEEKGDWIRRFRERLYDSIIVTAIDGEWFIGMHLEETESPRTLGILQEFTV